MRSPECTWAAWCGRSALSYEVNSDTQITAVAPSRYLGSSVDVRVTTPGGTSANTSSDDYTYQ